MDRGAKKVPVWFLLRWKKSVE